MRKLLIAAAVFAFSFAALAQPAPPPAPLGFTGSSEAVAFHYNGQWSAGTIVTESFDLIDFGASKTNRLFIAGKQLLAPTPGLNAYLADVSFQPDFSKLLNKTNVTPGSFSASIEGGVGVGIPATGNSQITWEAGGGVKYELTDKLTWQSLNGFCGRFGSTPFCGISTGLAYFFTK